jgi:hypothetical protein
LQTSAARRPGAAGAAAFGGAAARRRLEATGGAAGVQARRRGAAGAADCGGAAGVQARRVCRGGGLWRRCGGWCARSSAAAWRRLSVLLARETAKCFAAGKKMKFYTPGLKASGGDFSSQGL